MKWREYEHQESPLSTMGKNESQDKLFNQKFWKNQNNMTLIGAVKIGVK